MTVYTPREDSFLLRDYVLGKDLEGKKALDIGTGTGIIAVAMAKQGADVTAVDINPEAVEATKQMAEEEGIDIQVLQSDLFENVEGEFDIITFNPPYLPGEEGIGDEEIWRGGEKGTELTREFLEQVDQYLAEDGSAYIVLSSQAADLEEIREDYSLETVDSERLWFERLLIATYE